MKQMYNYLKQDSLLKSVGKVAVVVILMMVWILIDKGNVYGQSQVSIKSHLEMSDSDQAPLFKDGDEDGGLTDGELGGEGDEDNNFEVYPNPVEGDLVFDFEFTVRTDSPYEIIDPQGRLVRSGQIQSGIAAHSIDLSGLRTGMYIVRVELGGKHKVQRIIKQ